MTPSGTTPRDPLQLPEELPDEMGNELPSQSTAPSRRRQPDVSALWRRGWVRALGVVLIVAVALLISIPLVGAYVIEKVVVPRLAQRFGVELKLTEAKVRLRRVLLRGLIVRVPGKADPITAPRAEVAYSLMPLLHGQVELTEVTLDRPLLQLLRGGDDDNISPLLQRLRAPKTEAGGGSRRAWLSGPQTLIIRSAEVEVRDDAGILHVGGLDARLQRKGPSELGLVDSTAEIAGGATGRAAKVAVRWHSVDRFIPASLPEIEIEGGALVPYRRLAMTGIRGTIRPDSTEASRAVIDLGGGYGGVDRQLWTAKGWVRPDGNGSIQAGFAGQRCAEAQVSVTAQRFSLSSLEPILKNTPIIDYEKTEVDANLELRFAQRVLDFSGSFHMAGLTVFTPRLVAEPVRDLGLDLSARGRIDLKTRRFHLEKAAVKWNGATAELEADAEAQPASAKKPPPVAGPGQPGQPGQPASAGWRERWRSVYLHLVVPPIGCQALLDSLPHAIAPRIREFRLAGNFSTDVKVWVDFAKLMKLPPPTDPNSPDPQLTAEEEVNELAAILPPAAVAAARTRAQKPQNGGPQVKDPRDDPVQLSGRVGIDGCKVLEAPKDMNAARLLESFEHTVLVEADRELRFIIGPQNPDFVPYEELSPHLINSIMTTEDNGFLRHRGFIVPEFRSALQANLERGYFRLGASSITMQMVKNILLSREKTISRKLQELFITWYLENNLTSDADMLKAVGKGMSPSQYWLNKLQKTKAAEAQLQAEAMAQLQAEAMAKQAAAARQAAMANPQVMSPAMNSATASPQLGSPAMASPQAPRPGLPPAPLPSIVEAAGQPPAGPVTAAQAYSPLRDLTPIKRRILEIYFNAIEFGPYLYGIGKATRHYFGKAPKDLTPREAVWFSSILPNPKRRYISYCKGAPDEKWEKYLDRILRRVHERGRLTDEEYTLALQQRLLFDRTEALVEKDCLALIQRMTEPPPLGTAGTSTPPPIGPGQPGMPSPAPPQLPPVKLPPPPPWAEADVRTASRHHSSSR